MIEFTNRRTAISAAVLTALVATAFGTATATADQEERTNVTEPFDELSRIYPPTDIPRIYPPTDLYEPAEPTGG
jgi:hypothetical protein